MGWENVKKRANIPILSNDGITEIIKSCLKKDGKNVRHSRTIKMKNYRAPIKAEREITREEIENIKCEIIRYMAKSLLKECNTEESTKTIAECIKGWKEKNTDINISISGLFLITQMSNEMINKIIKENKKDTEISKFISKVYQTSCLLEKEHNGNNPIYPFKKTQYTETDTLWGYNKRIYLNPSLKNINSYKFLLEYIKKCIDKRIPFDMKGFGSEEHDENELDGMILYSHNNYFDSHLECVEDIIRENPEIMRSFGTPIYTGAQVKEYNGDSYYTIGAGYPCEYRPRTYNDYIDSSINLTYLIASARLIKQYFPLISKQYIELDEPTKQLIDKLNNLDKCSAKELQSIEVKSDFKESKIQIRELAYKIISYKRESGTEQEKEEGMLRLKLNFSNNFKMICSVLKFGDKEHINTPIYQDKSFIDFEEDSIIK